MAETPTNSVGEQLKANSLTLILLTALGGFVAAYISNNDSRAQKREEDFFKLMSEKDDFVKDQLMALVKENQRVSETVRSTLDKSQEIEIAFLRRFEESVKANNEIFKQILEELKRQKPFDNVNFTLDGEHYDTLIN